MRDPGLLCRLRVVDPLLLGGSFTLTRLRVDPALRHWTGWILVIEQEVWFAFRLAATDTGDALADLLAYEQSDKHVLVPLGKGRLFDSGHHPGIRVTRVAMKAVWAIVGDPSTTGRWLARLLTNADVPHVPILRTDHTLLYVRLQ